MKDDCYRLGLKNGQTMEVMVRNDELWLDIKNLSERQMEQLFRSGEETACEPTDGVIYVRATYFARIWPEHQTVVNDLARKLKLKLPWPEN